MVRPGALTAADAADGRSVAEARTLPRHALTTVTGAVRPVGWWAARANRASARVRRAPTTALLTLPLLLLAACDSELATAPTADAGHPTPIAAAARCRDCHAAPDGPTTDAPPAPTWHVVDCCGPDFDDCGDCHRVNAFRPPKFDHDQTSYPLTGRHRTGEGAPLRCDRCHTSPTATPTECADCHADDRPAISHTFVEPACDACHTTAGFTDPTPDHAVFPLDGPHPEVRCEGCHLEPQPIRSDCACCHTRDAFGSPVQHTFPLRWRPFAQGESPVDRTACFPDTPLEGNGAADCDACHSGALFGGAGYRHASLILTGGHDARREVGGRSLALCDQCHTDRAGTLGCGAIECHAIEHAVARRPEHPSDDLDCATMPGCHSPADATW